MKTYRRPERSLRAFLTDRTQIAFIGILLLLLLIPLTVYNINQQEKTRSSAAATAIISFSNVPQSVTVGQDFGIDVTMDPVGHQISFVKLTIMYDGTKLGVGSGGIVPNVNAFPVTLDGPAYQQCSSTTCSMSIALAVGSDPKKAIVAPTTVATVHFLAIASGTTAVTFGSDTQMLSVTATDKANENVLSTPNAQASVVITGNGTVNTPTPTSSQNPTPTPTSPVNTITPTDTPAVLPSSTPTPLPDPTANITLALPGTGIDGGNESPHHATRTVVVTLVNVNTHKKFTATGTISYDSAQTTDQLSIIAFFSNTNLDLGAVHAGTYQISAKVDQYLQGKLTDAIDLTPGQNVKLPRTQLIIGDIAPIPGTNGEPFGDNVLDIQDYNIFVSCFGVKAATRICPNRLGSDLNDDGLVDGTDYNLLLIGFKTLRDLSGPMPTPTPRTFQKNTPTPIH